MDGTHIRRRRAPAVAALLLGTALAAALVASCADSAESPSPRPEEGSAASLTPTDPDDDPLTVVTETTRLMDVMAAPEFAGFGDVIFPSSDRITAEMTIADVGRLLSFHSNIRGSEVAVTLNEMLAGVREGTVTFHRVYSQDEIAADAAKAEVVLFYFRGEDGAPFGIALPGGGFSYVGSIHEGFPYAQAMVENGVNGFVLNYRVGGGGVPATEDLAHAIDYIFENQEALGVSTDGYSLWGSSAGARMAANLGSYGTAAFGATDRPRPAAVIMAYTGHSDFTANDPATFAVVGSQDRIASPATMRTRIDNLARAGIATEFHLFDGVGHGFGLGTGTAAEGWVDDAMRFWSQQIGER